ncbi:Outer membrane protein TolC [compost metagenome]
MQRQSGSDRLHNQNHSIGLRLSLPLFEGGARRSAVREARNLLLKAEADLDDARRSAMLAARRAWLGISGGMARIGALEAAERSSQSALEANRLGYRLGMRVGLDVLDAQSQLADTRQQLSRARYDTLLATLQLRASGGALDVDDLLAINSLLERQD